MYISCMTRSVFKVLNSQDIPTNPSQTKHASVNQSASYWLLGFFSMVYLHGLSAFHRMQFLLAGWCWCVVLVALLRYYYFIIIGSAIDTHYILQYFLEIRLNLCQYSKGFCIVYYLFSDIRRFQSNISSDTVGREMNICFLCF